jgi:hypothetical protein
MLPPSGLRSDRLREMSIDTPSAIAASSTSDPAATDAKIATRGMGVDEEDEAAERVVAAPVCAAVDRDPVDGTVPCCLDCLAATCFVCFLAGLCFGCDAPTVAGAVVVGGGADVVVGGGEDVVGGGLLVVGGGGDVVGGGGGGGGGVPATATAARARPAASAATHPTTDPMTLVALNVPLCASVCPRSPARAWY